MMLAVNRVVGNAVDWAVHESTVAAEGTADVAVTACQ
jgi:hypothetical protein